MVGGWMVAYKLTVMFKLTLPESNFLRAPLLRHQGADSTNGNVQEGPAVVCRLSSLLST